MKAIVVAELGSPDVLKYREVDVPPVVAQQVRIRVHATSVNFADIKARYGRYHGATQPPFIPGLDAAGVIEAVGADGAGALLELQRAGRAVSNQGLALQLPIRTRFQPGNDPERAPSPLERRLIRCWVIWQRIACR